MFHVKHGDLSMWREGFSPEEIFYVESAVVAESPGRDQEAALPFQIDPDMWPLISLSASGTTLERQGAGSRAPHTSMAVMVMSWKEMARVHAAIDEVVRVWPEERITRYNALCDQSVMEYRKLRREFDGEQG